MGSRRGAETQRGGREEGFLFPVSSCLLSPGPIFLAIAGLALSAAGLWAVATDAEGWNTVWYIPAWYGYLTMLDALILARQGHSFLRGRLREAGAMLFWSVPFWYLFEACNLVLGNWYYVFTPRADLSRLVMGVAAFATVFPACFVHAELMRVLGLRNLRPWKPLKMNRRRQALILTLGTGCIVLPLLFPLHFFWAVWWAPFWIPELLNYRSGAPSLLRDLEKGRPDRLLQLMAGGLIAGGIWEFFNYWARCKWIYTVYGFEDWKLFEMPLAGFLGFPVLALGAFSFYSLICHHIRAGRHWEARPASPMIPKPRWRFWAAAAAGVVVVLTVHQAGRGNVRSVRPLLHELQALDASQADRLRECGIPTPERLYREASSGGIEQIAQQCQLDAPTLQAALRQTALALHKGMGPEFSKLLLQSGIQRVSDLAGKDPDRLAERLKDLAESRSLQVPRRTEVRVWIQAAKGGNGPRR